MLHELAAGTTGLLAVPASLLAELPDTGLHVLSPPIGPRLPGELRCAQLLLDSGEECSTQIMVYVSPELLRSLPTCFDVLRSASRLVPSVSTAALEAIGDAEDESSPDDEFGPDESDDMPF
jgi:hypothetical protein